MKKIMLGIGILISCLLILFAIYITYYLKSIKYYVDDDFKIETYKSSIDKDRDGIDDQTDILENVKKYIATKPKYKSKYYNTGYPNDEY